YHALYFSNTFEADRFPSPQNNLTSKLKENVIYAPQFFDTRHHRYKYLYALIFEYTTIILMLLANHLVLLYNIIESTGTGQQYISYLRVKTLAHKRFVLLRKYYSVMFFLKINIDLCPPNETFTFKKSAFTAGNHLLRMSAVDVEDVVLV
ncbi:hypothetical protein L9F63_011843, partial [Diploptera punctata]